LLRQHSARLFFNKVTKDVYAQLNPTSLTFAVLSALLLIAARPAPAQIEKVLYSFGAQATDGFSPESSLTSHDGGSMGRPMKASLGLDSIRAYAERRLERNCAL